MCHPIRYGLSLTLILLPLLVGPTDRNHTVLPCIQGDTPTGCVEVTLKPGVAIGDFYLDGVLTVRAQNTSRFILSPNVDHTVEVKNIQSTEVNFGTLFNYPDTSTIVKVKVGQTKTRTIVLTRNYIRGLLKVICDIRHATSTDRVACGIRIDGIAQPDVAAGQSASYVLDPGSRLIAVSVTGDDAGLFDPAGKEQVVKIAAGKKNPPLRVTFTKKGHLLLGLDQAGVVADFYLDGGQIATQVATVDVWVAPKVTHIVEAKNLTDPAAAGVYVWKDVGRKVRINAGAERLITFSLKKQFVKGLLAIECAVGDVPGAYCVPIIDGIEQAAIAAGVRSQYPLDPGSHNVVVKAGPTDLWEPVSVSRTFTIRAGETKVVKATFAALELVPTYIWLSKQQDGATGLLASQQDRFASTYNNALAVMAFTLKGDYAKAKQILDFFDSKAAEFFNDSGCGTFASPCSQAHLCGGHEPCGFYQYRDSITGVPAQDANRWMGDNAWLLMAIHHYQAQTVDSSYQAMADAIIRFLRSLQQPDGYVASGWEHGDTTFSGSGHAEGNLDAYKALLLYDETPAAQGVKQWLDYHDLAWKKGPLDLHSWRVLSLGQEYGYTLLDTELIDDPISRYQSTITYNNASVTGFLPHPLYCQENIWSEGTGSMAVGFYKAGYQERGDFYVDQLESLLFEPQGYAGIQALSFFPLPSPCDTWADSTKGHVAPATWYIFAKEHFDPFDGVVMSSFETVNPLVQIEAENHKLISPVGVRADNRGSVFEGKAIHLGGDNNIADDESGWAEYRFNLLSPATINTFMIRYADDVGGDSAVVLLDGSPIAGLITADTGTWDDYMVADLSTGSIELQPGPHTLRLEVADSGTYGFTVDYLQMNIR